MHVAIIMDGNGRWAEQRGLPRSAGHRAGALAVRRIVEAAAHASVDVLTLYAFSSENWSRPAPEVGYLMRLLRRSLLNEVARCVENGVSIRAIGRRDRLSPDLVQALERAERTTGAGTRMRLQLAIDYSARAAIAGAASLARSQSCSVEDFGGHLAAATRSCGAGAVDLLIRTGGERRLSDFLLWECAYAELVFVDKHWPDFDEIDFSAARHEFERRSRRFGGLTAKTRATSAGAEA